MRRGLAAMLAVLLWGNAAVARETGETGEVRVRLPACATAPFDGDEFLDVLRVELAPDAVVVGTGTGTTLDVEMPCGGPSAGVNSVTIRVRIDARPPAVRRMDLGDLPLGTRPRGIALVAAELVRSARSGEPPAPPLIPAPAPDRHRADPAPRPESPKMKPPPWDLRAAAEARIFLVAPTVLFGASLGARVHRTRFSVGLLRGSADDLLGRTDLTLVYGSAGFELWRFQAGRFELVATPRAAVGMIAADPTANPKATSRSSREAYFDGALELDARFRLGAAAWATLEADAGYARGLVAVAGDRVIARPEGVFVGLRLGIAIAP